MRDYLNISAVFVLCILCAKAFPQDTIITLQDITIPVKVIELNYAKSQVKYKKSKFIEGPLYTEYMSNIFLINVKNEPSIFNDPFDNPYPGYKSIVPVTLRRIEYYSPSAIAEHKRNVINGYMNLKSCSIQGLSGFKEVHFRLIFNRVVKATKEYLRSRKFSVGDDFNWEYIYATTTAVGSSRASCVEQDHFMKERLENASSFGYGKFIFGEPFFLGQTDDVIAGVIAHEIGHALARHSIEKKRKLENLEAAAYWGGIGLSLRHGGSVEANRNTINFLGLNFLFKPYSRKFETEADKIGTVLMSLAGYDPMEIVKFWGSGEKATHTAWHSTHPGGIERAKDILKFINSPEFRIATFKR